MSGDPYCDPELEIAQIRDAELLRSPEPGIFDLDHLCRIHRRLFGDVYAWAGKIRTVAIAKTAHFALPQFIEGQARAIFTGLAEEDYLHGYERDRFVKRLAHYLGEVNALHPFREGNGRAQRAFFRQLTSEAGWWVDWTQVDREDNDEASRESLSGDLTHMEALLDRIVGPI